VSDDTSSEKETEGKSKRKFRSFEETNGVLRQYGSYALF